MNFEDVLFNTVHYPTPFPYPFKFRGFLPPKSSKLFVHFIEFARAVVSCLHPV